MNLISKERLLEELITLNKIYGPKKSTGDLIVIAEEFYKDCNDMSEKYFLEAVMMYRKTGKFFPVPADIIENYFEIVGNIHEKQPKQITENVLSPEEAAIYIKQIRERKKAIVE